MDLQFDAYEEERDWKAVECIWRDIGWMGDEIEPIQTELSLEFARVARLNGNAESFAIGADASLHYLNQDLPLAGITAVGTSALARKRGIASQLTARLVAEMADAGAAAAMLGIFDQGYYDRLGFGSGTYDRLVSFHPADLKVSPPQRMPCRIDSSDWEEMHRCRTSKRKIQGGVTFKSPTATRCETIRKNQFGYGFRDEATGELTHYMWCRATDRGMGPYQATLVYSVFDQLLELLGVIKSLGDQVRLFRVFEPPGIQFQDLISRPFLRVSMSKDSQFQTGIRCFAASQVRICDLAACIRATRIESSPVSFNLQLEDPIAEYLGDYRGWRGVAGSYTITFGPESTVQSGHAPGCHTLTASVGAFTRLWLNVQNASSLAVTDRLDAPARLLQSLDRALNFSRPTWDWRF